MRILTSLFLFLMSAAALTAQVTVFPVDEIGPIKRSQRRSGSAAILSGRPMWAIHEITTQQAMVRSESTS